MDNLHKHIGVKIKHLRKSARLTTAELGYLSDTSQSTISAIERGERSTIHIDTLIQICKALNVTLYEVLPDNIFSPPTKENEEDSPELIQLFGLVRTLSPSEIQLAIKLLLRMMKVSKTDRENLASLLNSLMNR